MPEDTYSAWITQALQLADERQDDDPEVIAATVARGMNQDRLREFAIGMLSSYVAGHRRQQARVAEDRAAREAQRIEYETAQQTAREVRRSEQRLKEEQHREWCRQRSDFVAAHPARVIREWGVRTGRVVPDRGAIPEGIRQEYAEAIGVEYVYTATARENLVEWRRDDPQHAVAPTPPEFIKYRDCLAGPGVWLDAHERKKFRRWLGKDFADWYERARAAAANTDERSVAFFESNWHPDGPMAYYEELRRKQIYKLIYEVAAQTRLEVTTELLNTQIALGDGTMVTWGTATVEQHRQRIEMLAKNASGIVETAARHGSAIAMITDANATCLNELKDGQQ